jgi:hypothetical protein
VRHRRHTLASAHPRTLRATAAAPCVAALLAAVLTGAAPGAETREDSRHDGPSGAAVISAKDGADAKSPRTHGTSPTAVRTGGHTAVHSAAWVRPSALPSPSAADARDARSAYDGNASREDPKSGGSEKHDADERPGTYDAEGPGRGPAGDSGERSGEVPGDVSGDMSGAFGTQDLYETEHSGPGSPGEDSAATSEGAATTAATGQVSPVLPFGAGLTLIGLGLALIALRLRHT